MTADCVVTTPVGRVRIVEDAGAIAILAWSDAPVSRPTTSLLHNAAEQLNTYFAGHRTAFELPLAPAGTAHQKKVWAAMCAIPFGAVRTYGGLAAKIGSSARAVGTACGKNPIPIIVPCHRIIAAGNSIGGYSGRGGVVTKRALLNLEGAYRNKQSSLDLEAPEAGR